MAASEEATRPDSDEEPSMANQQNSPGHQDQNKQGQDNPDRGQQGQGQNPGQGGQQGQNQKPGQPGQGGQQNR